MRAEIDFFEVSRCMLRRPNERRFAAHFGCTSSVCFIIWQQIAFVDSLGCEPKHLLWTLNFLKVYETDAIMANSWHVCEDTFKRKVTIVIDALYTCLPEV